MLVLVHPFPHTLVLAHLHTHLAGAQLHDGAWSSALGAGGQSGCTHSQTPCLCLGLRGLESRARGISHTGGPGRGWSRAGWSRWDSDVAVVHDQGLNVNIQIVSVSNERKSKHPQKKDEPDCGHSIFFWTPLKTNK